MQTPLVEQQDDGTWLVTCRDERCGYTSRNHSSKTDARDKAVAHKAEHEGGGE